MTNVEFSRKFKEFILLYPSIHSIGGQQSLVYSAGFDSQLQDQIQFNTNSKTFVSLLSSTLKNYGTLSDGRNPFAEIIKDVMGSVGIDRREVGQQLLDELGAGIFEEPVQEPVQEKPISSDIVRELAELSRCCEEFNAQLKRVCHVLENL